MSGRTTELPPLTKVPPRADYLSANELFDRIKIAERTGDKKHCLDALVKVELVWQRRSRGRAMLGHERPPVGLRRLVWKDETWP